MSGKPAPLEVFVKYATYSENVYITNLHVYDVVL